MSFRLLDFCTVLNFIFIFLDSKLWPGVLHVDTFTWHELCSGFFREKSVNMYGIPARPDFCLNISSKMLVRLKEKYYIHKTIMSSTNHCSHTADIGHDGVPKLYLYLSIHRYSALSTVPFSFKSLFFEWIQRENFITWKIAILKFPKNLNKTIWKFSLWIHSTKRRNDGQCTVERAR